MLFEKRYYYYRVKFDGENAYWYRSLSSGYRPGAKVIVPVTNNGKWEIGVVTEKKKCKVNEVPYPIEKTKGIVKTAGWFSKSEVKKHNNRIEKSPYPPCDISVSSIKTKQGYVNYITCRKERNYARESLQKYTKLLIVENYPCADFREIPLPVQKQIREREQKEREIRWQIQEEKRRAEREELLKSIEFEEEMEDLDQYN